MNVRLHLSAEHESWMMMSGIIALCALVIVGVLVLPVFGPRVATVTAVGVVTSIVLLCYLICVPRAFTRHPLRGGPRRNGT